MMTTDTQPAKTNGFDPDQVQSFVDRIENVLAQLDTKRGEYMRECKGLREDIKEIYKEAKLEGLPKKALKAVIERHILERRIDEARDELDAPDQDSYDLILHALGELADLPLGRAALDAAA